MAQHNTSRCRRRLLQFGACAALVGLTRKRGVLAQEGEDRLVAPGADVWHSDAFGAYSNVSVNRQGSQGREHELDTTGLMFLRGTQITDRHGIVEFDTVVPGWYLQSFGSRGFPRVTHVHLKVFHADRSATMQAYLPDAFNDRIYRSVAPYKDTPERRFRDGRAVSRIHNDDDRLFKAGDPLLDVAEEGAGITASAIVGLDQASDLDSREMRRFRRR